MKMFPHAHFFHDPISSHITRLLEAWSPNKFHFFSLCICHGCPRTCVPPLPVLFFRKRITQIFIFSYSECSARGLGRDRNEGDYENFDEIRGNPMSMLQFHIQFAQDAAESMGHQTQRQN